MVKPHETGYADIIQVRTVTGAAACNQLLAEGWVLLGVLPLTTVAEMTSGGSGGEMDAILFWVESHKGINPSNL